MKESYDFIKFLVSEIYNRIKIGNKHIDLEISDDDMEIIKMMYNKYFSEYTDFVKFLDIVCELSVINIRTPIQIVYIMKEAIKK